MENENYTEVSESINSNAREIRLALDALENGELTREEFNVLIVRASNRIVNEYNNYQSLKEENE